MNDIQFEKIHLQQSFDDIVGVLSRLNEMRLSGETHDSVLKTEDGGWIPVHRIVLISASDYFKALYTSSLNEDGDRFNVLVPGVTALTLSRVVNFAYGQSLEIKDSEIMELLVAADMLLYQPLVTMCFKHLTHNMNAQNCLRLYQYIKAYNMKDFKESVKLYVVNNFANIPKNCPTLAQVSGDTLEDILRDDRLTMREEMLWEIVESWLDMADEKNKLTHAAQLIGCLRLAYLDTDFIFGRIMCHPSIVHNSACREVIRQRQDVMWKLAEVFCSAPDVDTPYIARPRLPQDLLIAVGGYENVTQKTVGIVEVYDCKADLWCQMNREDTEIQEAKKQYHACVFLDNCIYVLGGEESGTGRVHNTVACWDMMKKMWYFIPSMKQQRCRFCAVMANDTIIVIGGFQSNFRTLATMEQFHPKYNTWTYLESMRANRCSAAAAVLGQKIYVCGGSTNRLDQLKSVEAYDLVSYTWESVQHMNTPRKGASAINFRGQLWVAGGKNLKSIERYDPTSDTWTRIGQMLEPRSFFTLAVLDSVLFAIGGCSSENRSDVSGSEAFCERTNSWRPVTASQHQISFRAACVARSPVDAGYYLCQNRENLLKVKMKLVQTYKEKGDVEKAKEILRIFT